MRLNGGRQKDKFVNSEIYGERNEGDNDYGREYIKEREQMLKQRQWNRYRGPAVSLARLERTEMMLMPETHKLFFFFFFGTVCNFLWASDAPRKTL